MKEKIRLSILLLAAMLFPFCIALADDDAQAMAVYEAALEERMEDCFGAEWKEKVTAYAFLNTLDDGDLFAILSEQGKNIVKILTLSDGEVTQEVTSECALFQDPVTEIYIEIEDEVNVYFESGAGMCFAKRDERPWALCAYEIPLDSGRCLAVGFFDGPLLHYSVEDQEKGEMETDTLCGWTAYDLELTALNVKHLPSTVEALKQSVSNVDGNRYAFVAKADTGAGETLYATCELSPTQANIRIYALGDIFVQRGGELLRIGGFDVAADGTSNKRIPRHFNSDVDVFYGNTDITLDLEEGPHRIDVRFIWDDGSVDDRVSFSFE